MSRQEKMHADELVVDAGLVRRLLAGQHPDLAERELRLVRSTGTVNAIFRLGEDLCVRLPRTADGVADLERELTWLPRLAPHLSVPVPAPVARGEATDDFPSTWAVYRWVEGTPYADALITDEESVAAALAGFVRELRAVPTDEAPPGGRRPLRELDAGTRATFLAGADRIDAAAALAVWRDAVAAPAFSGPRQWLHSDLLRPNVLVADGRLAAVIDFGGAGVGDAALDVIAAWAVFGPAGRRVYRAELDVDDPTWVRARAYALHQAAAIIPYYVTTNPAFVDLAVRTVEQVLLDAG